MKYNSGKHRRCSIRLKHYNYASPGAYFVTICTQNQECVFGDIVNGEMKLNDAGHMVTKWYYELENKFPDIKHDELICMPNHVHLIVINGGTAAVAVGADLRVCPYDNHDNSDNPDNAGGHTGSPLQRVVQWFKTMTTNEYIRGVKQNGWPPFPGKLWQRNYYERIIRTENDLNRIRQYIVNNPLNWKFDENFEG